MNKADFDDSIEEFVRNSEDNLIDEKKAISPAVIGLRMFESPIVFVGAADDEMFREFASKDGLGKSLQGPFAWLPTAKSVISIFFPFTDAVKVSNRADKLEPSSEWLHARIEGQMFIDKATKYLRAYLEKSGYKTVAPSIDQRFWSKTAFNPATPHPEVSFTSNWSERHIAFLCGMGTFGLSKGLITEKGMAGRFTSLITELELPANPRSYDEPYEYCIKCGACVRRCPANAISLEKGKNHMVCFAYLNETGKKYSPRYGCGKCQVGVPCERKIPKRI